MSATDLERLVVQLSADIKKYENALNRAQGVTNKRARAIESRFAKMNKTIASGYNGLAVSAVKAFAVIGGVNGFKNLSDSATRIDNALKVAGLSGEALEKTYQALFAAATKNGAPIEALVTLYGKLALVQKELGVSGAELEKFSSNVALALRVAGADAQSASGALLQLSQALGGGVVRAEEFNSVLEGAPTIAQAVAAGLKEAGGSVAELRKLVIDGKVSSEAFFRAFEAGAPLLEGKVANSVFTIDQRLTNLQTALTNAAREFNESAKAGETFGAAIDGVARFVSNIDFDNLITQVQAVAAQLQVGIEAANTFYSVLGRLSGFEGIGRDIVNMLPGDGASKSFLGGGLTVTSTAGITDRINQAFEGEIQKSGQLTSEALKNSVLGKTGGVIDQTKAGRLAAAPSTEVKPVSLSDFAVPDDDKKKKKKTKQDDLAREIEQIKQRTALLQAETTAMAGLNPLIDDYGFAMERARAKQELLTAAQEAGKQITPALAAEIDNLSTAYATAVVESEKLAEKQDEIRERAENAMATAKDAVRGIIDGFTDGAKAGDILLDTLKKIGDSLLNDVLDSIFKVNSAGSGGGGLLSGLFGLFGGGGKSAFPSAPGGLYSEGGYTGAGGKYQPAGIVHKGEYVMDAETTKRIGVGNLRRLQGYAAGGLVGAPRMTVLGGKDTGAGSSITYAPTIDARGADSEAVARLERVIANDKADFQSRVVSTVREAQKRRSI
tara:strand:+ start:20279 stop:22453 length:2175 start_codon:yes stop_codon:yes gene_type:complete